MASNITILHISDIHRITEANVDCLRASFNVEKEYYRANNIPMPSFIVVSGDIIQGSRETEPQKAQEEIRSQYDVAGRFLAGLCDMTGGHPIITTTIITKNSIFVPVIPEMYQYFDLAQNEGKLEFYVRFDPLTA